MRAAAALSFFVLLGGCEPAVKKEPATSDEDMLLIKAEYPGLTDECLNRVRWEGGGLGDASEGCFKMEPARRWQGLWRTGFEISRFCPAPAAECQEDIDDSPKIWLTSAAPIRRPAGPSEASLYALDFVGRKTAFRGGYGHLNGYEHGIVVDRIISIRMVGGVGPPPFSSPEK